MARLVLRMGSIGSIKDLKTLCSKQIRNSKYEAEVIGVDGNEATVEVTGKVKLFRYDLNAIEGEIIEEED